MADDDLCFLSLAELASLMRARTVSPVEHRARRSTRDNVPTEDAEAVRRLKDAGA